MTYRASVTLQRSASTVCPFNVALYRDGELVESFAAETIGDANTLGRCLVNFEDDTAIAFAAYQGATSFVNKVRRRLLETMS